VIISGLLLAEIKFPQTGFVDDTDWKSPDVPSLYDALDLRVPASKKESMERAEMIIVFSSILVIKKLVVVDWSSQKM
jgi:hypothetical protein